MENTNRGLEKRYRNPFPKFVLHFLNDTVPVSSEFYRNYLKNNDNYKKKVLNKALNLNICMKFP